MLSSFIETYKILGYSIVVPLAVFIVLAVFFYFLLRKATPEKARRLLLRMEFFILLAFFLNIFIFAFCIGTYWIDNNIVQNLGFSIIAGTGAAFILTGLIYLAFMVRVFTFFIEKFDNRLFQIPLYFGYMAIFKRYAHFFMMMIVYVSFFFSSSFLIGYYFENPNITIYFYSIIFLLYYIFYPAIIKSSGKAKEIRDGEIFNGYMELLEKSHVSPKKISIIQSPYGFANALAIGFLPGFTEIILFKPLADNLSIQETRAILAHELAHIKMNHVLYRVFYTLIYVFIIGKIHVMENSSMFTMPTTIIFAIIYIVLTGRQEKDADTFAAEMTTPEDLISALKKIDLINRKARGELVEKSFFEMTGRRSPMDVRCDDILKRCGNNIETQDSKDVNITE